MTTSSTPPTRAAMLRTLLLGGLLPILAFALVEEFYGTIGGLIAGIVFGAGEMIYEWIRFRKIQGITIAANLLVIGLGSISLIEEDSRLFKLQPAILLFAFAALLLGSSLLKKPFLVELAKKQMPTAPAIALQKMSAMNWRAGLFMIGLALISVRAAYTWTTAEWAFFKGIGTPLLLAIYLGAEILVARWRARR